MTVRCPSCSANLRVNTERLGGRPSAKCPSCQASVPLTPGTATQSGAAQPDAAMAQEKLVVTCPSCKTRLKAPASRVGSRSTCPKCRTAVLIEGTPAVTKPGVLVAAAGSDNQEESSTASTRRIDSRMIGMMSAAKPEGVVGVDLDAFLKTGATPATDTLGSDTPHAEKPTSTPTSDPGTVAPLLKPPVAAIEKAAKEIRQAAETLTAETLTQAPSSVAPEAGKRAGAARQESSTTSPAHPARRQTRSEVEHVEARPSHASDEPALSGDPYFPAWRGLLCGGVAGLIMGATEVAINMSRFALFVPPLPLRAGLLGLPENAVRIMFVVLLGMVAGF